MSQPSASLLLVLACCASARANFFQDEQTKYIRASLQGRHNSVEVKQPETSDESVVMGGKVTLKCTVEDHDNSSLQWSNPAQQTLYFGDKKALRDNRIELVKSTSNELTISISDVGMADEGVYTCAIFTMPVLMAKALVTVLGEPQNPLISGHEIAFKEGEKAKLTCKTSGSKPAAQISWYKGVEKLEGALSEVKEDPHRKTFDVTSQIEFPVTQEDNEARITCTVGHESLQNAYKSSDVHIQVYYKPTAKIDSQPHFPREGEKLHLLCLAYGNPRPSVDTWEKEGGELPPQARAQKENLAFLFVNKSDSGVYMCRVKSPMGTYIAKHNLDVSGTYLTHEAKGSDDAPDADTAIINAEGGQSSGDDKKEYFI